MEHKTHVEAVRKFISAHPLWSIVIGVLVFATLWWLYSKFFTSKAQAHYVVGTVTKGTIVSSISASGQIAASQTLELKPKASGSLIYVGVHPGQVVAAGTLVAEIDPTEAQKAVRDAQANLEAAKLSLAKLQEPADTLTLSQAQNQLAQAQLDLASDYQASVTDITNTFLDLPSIMTGLQNVNFGTDASNGQQWNIDYYGSTAANYNPKGTSYRTDAYMAYQVARQAYDKTFADYKALSSSPDTASTEALLTETYTTATLIQNAIKSSYTLIQFYSDQVTQAGLTPKSASNTHLTNLNSYTGKINPHITSMLNDTNTLSTQKSTILEKQQSLAKTKAGTDTLDLQSSQLTVTQRANALQDAQDALANYFIHAPFAGTIGAVTVKKFDTANSGISIATLITTDQLADLSINEVDAANIHVGDKATLTFDAISDLTLTGTVAEIDPVGTVSQGVVSYDLKIQFSSQDSRVRPGMTVNAQIQTAAHTNVLMVPQSAVKTQNGQSYVLVFVPPITSSAITLAGSQGITSATKPQQIPVEVGISDDTKVEITSGLTEGQQLVTRTVTGNTANKSTAPTSSARGGAPGIRL